MSNIDTYNLNDSQSHPFYNYLNQNQGKFFVEYFYLIGMDPDLIFQDFLYSNDLKKINENIRIKPKIISKVPDFDKTVLNIEEEIILKVNIILNKM
jgi:hypothetical protein